MQAEAGISDLASIGEKAPIRPDADQTGKYRTPHTAAPTLTRTSLAAGPLARVSAAPSNGATSPAVSAGHNSLVRVSAAAYPKLARASQAGIARNSVIGAGSGGLTRSSVVKGLEESRNRPDARESLGIELEIVDVTTGKLAVYKNDGERFPGSKYTLKLTQGHDYRFSVTVEDGIALDDSTIIFTYLNASGSLLKQPVECARKSKTYSGVWKCSSAPSAKGGRTHVELSMKFADFPVATLKLNAKIYTPSKGTSGSSLKSVIVKFGAASGSASIKKEQWIAE